jgi:non-canonical (house-cleaning) NTP pyrophosphatase
VASYLVFCVFEVATSDREDYSYVYMDLSDIGLRRAVKAERGPSFDLPATAVMGMREGQSASDVKSRVGKELNSIFKTRGFAGKFFIVVAGDWACVGDEV